MQKNALVSRGESQPFLGFLGRATVQVPKNQHLALPVWKFGERISQYPAQPRPSVKILGCPDLRCIDRTDSRQKGFHVRSTWLMIPFELRCREHTTRTGARRGGTVPEDSEQPCPERGASLEPVDRAKCGQPGILNHVLRVNTGSHMRLGVGEHLGPKVLKGAAERLGVPLHESFSKESLDGRPVGGRTVRWGEVGIG